MELGANASAGQVSQNVWIKALGIPAQRRVDISTISQTPVFSKAKSGTPRNARIAKRLK
jgi:hypothetical protein